MWLLGRKKTGTASDAPSSPKPQLDLGGVVPSRWSEPNAGTGTVQSADPSAPATADPQPLQDEHPATAAPFEPAASADPVEAPSGPTANAAEASRSDRRTWFAFKWTAYAAALAVTVAGLWVGANIFYYTLKFPDPLALADDRKTPMLRILARDGTLLAERGAAHPYMPIALLPRHVVDAVVAIEDRRFFEHWGVDPVGLLRATVVNMRAGRFVQGGSTLTQQLAKNLFLSPERTVTRKLDEVVIAVWLELRLTKEEILELYLNRVYFGGGAYGIEAAAQRYFDKSARAVSVAEAAVLAGLLKAPSRFAPTSNPGLARARGRVVLATMLETGAIDTDMLARARSKPVRFAKAAPERVADAHGYAVDYVLDSMPELIQAGQGEVIVETTIDAGLQSKAHAGIARLIGEEGDGRDARQAAMVVLGVDGGVRAMVGGVDYHASQFNRAVKARRQPGSTFKPFVYLSALENGMTPDTVTYDLPISIDGWSPRNVNGQFSGAVSLRDALARSINTVAVRLTLDAGAEKVAAIAARLGIGENLVAEPSIALGTSEVSLLDLTGAYTVFAADGRKVTPHVIDRIRTTSGRVLYAHAPAAGERLVSRSHVAAMNDMLNAALVAGTGRRAGLPDHPAAGKTGTSQDFRDAWFVGYSAHLAAGVWVGNDRGTPMQSVSGGSLPAKIWRQVMSTAHDGLEPLPLPGTAWQGARLAQASTSASRNGRSLTPDPAPRAQNGVAFSHARRTVAREAPSPFRTPPPPVRKAAVASPILKPGPNPIVTAQPNLAPATAPLPRPRPHIVNRSLKPADRSVAKADIGQRLVIRPPAPVAARPTHPNASLPSDIFLQAASTPMPGSGQEVASTGFDADDIRRRLGVGGPRAPATDVAAQRQLEANMEGMMSLGANAQAR